MNLIKNSISNSILKLFPNLNRQAVTKVMSIWITLGMICLVGFQLTDLYETYQKENEIVSKEINLYSEDGEIGDFKCFEDKDCNHGKCIREKDIFNNYKNNSYCECG